MRIEELVAELGDLSRNREALFLIILQGERAVPALSEVLLGMPSSIPEPRCLAADALGAIGGEGAVSALIRVLSLYDLRQLDPVLRLAEEAVRNRAAEQLGKLGDRRAVEPLLYVLAREGLREAMRALALFQEERAIPHVVRRLEDPCDRAAAREALLLFGVAAVPALRATVGEPRPSAEDEAPTSVERRAEAVSLLAILGGKAVIPLLLKALEDEAVPVRLEAALGLVGFADAQAPECALALIAQGLLHSNPAVAMRSMDALVEVGDSSIPHLLWVGPRRLPPAVGPRQPGDDIPQVTAIETLERIGTEASARGLQEYLQDRSPLVRARAERALLHLGVPPIAKRRQAVG
jgi:HEAT repeat protein